jgi:16S rRNA U516 pseudouridylate synthase RsuA-like enzyme
MNTSEFRRLTTEAATYVEQLEAREAELALAAEQLSQEAAVQMAFREGQQHERDRLVRLIDMQQSQLSRGDINALVLGALKRQVRGDAKAEPHGI